MTRENLLKAIYDSSDDWSCTYSCPYTMEEQDPQKVCMECANRLLTEYEQKIRADAIDECIAEINKLNIEIAYPHTICNILEQLKEQKNG